MSESNISRRKHGIGRMLNSLFWKNFIVLDLEVSEDRIAAKFEPSLVAYLNESGSILQAMCKSETTGQTFSKKIEAKFGVAGVTFVPRKGCYSEFNKILVSGPDVAKFLSIIDEKKPSKNKPNKIASGPNHPKVTKTGKDAKGYGFGADK
jgi:hypothetical protein